MPCVGGASGFKTLGVPLTPLGRPRPFEAAGAGAVSGMMMIFFE